MLFKIDDKVYTPQTSNCAIIFKDDEERLRVIELLSSMPSSDGERWFGSHPDTMTREEFEQWSVLTDEEKKLMVSVKRIREPKQ